MQTNRCAHFSIDIEMLPVQQVVLRVPVRRCSLAEQMIAILRRTEEGREIAEQIQILASTPVVDKEGNPTTPEIRAAFGPDLEAIHQPECTTMRCLQSCTPGYRLMLSHFGYVEEAALQTGEGCLEASAEASDAFA